MDKPTVPSGTVALRRPLAPRGGARSSVRSRWRSPRDGCSRDDSHYWLNTASSGEAVARYPSGSLGREEALLSGLKPGLSAPTSPSPQRLGGAPGSLRPAPVGPQSLRKAPTLLSSGSLPFSLTPLVLSRTVGAEIGPPLTLARSAGVSASEQSPRPDVSAGNWHAHTPERARPAPALPGISALGRDPLLRVSSLYKPCSAASPGPITHRGTARQGFPERVWRQKLATDLRRWCASARASLDFGTSAVPSRGRP